MEVTDSAAGVAEGRGVLGLGLGGRERVASRGSAGVRAQVLRGQWALPGV